MRSAKAHGKHNRFQGSSSQHFLHLENRDLITSWRRLAHPGSQLRGRHGDLTRFCGGPPCHKWGCPDWTWTQLTVQIRVDRAAQSNMVATGHMWLTKFRCKLNISTSKFISSAVLATCQVPDSHLWLVVPHWIAPVENMSIVTEVLFD